MNGKRLSVVTGCLLIVMLSGCFPPSGACTEGVLAEDHRLMSKAELIRYLDRLEDELVRVDTGGAVPGGVPREGYAADLRQRMKDVQREIGLRNIWERKSYWERREMIGPTR